MSDFSWPDVLDAVAARRDLDPATVSAAMRAMLSGEATPAQIAAFLTGMRTKGETTEEITAALRTMQELATPVKVDDAIDTCGTGGDRSGSVNISTMAAFVAAGAGARVAKHGNRSVSSSCGSADVLEALGVAIDLSPGGVAACVDEAGMGFMLAPSFHPGMRHVMPVRRELGIRTLFNIVAPLANPASVRRQVVGVADAQLAPRIADVLALARVQRAMVFRGDDGLDELSTTTTSRVWDVDGEVLESSLDPSSFLIERATLDDLRGGDKETNARIATGVFAGEHPRVADAVALNAAAALVVAGIAKDVNDGLDRARESLSSGKAAGVLARLRETSQRVAK